MCPLGRPALGPTGRPSEECRSLGNRLHASLVEELRPDYMRLRRLKIDAPLPAEKNLTPRLEDPFTQRRR